jgi:hypothetical protein
MAPHSVGPEPEELSRAISELDLTTLRGTDGTADEAEPGNGRRYTRDQLLGIRSKSSQVDVVINLADIAGGTRTPPVHTTAPPPTPEHPSAAPVSQPCTTFEQPKEEGAADEPTPQADIPNEGAAEEEPKKKKKKKSSGKNKKPAPTGFEEFYADPPITPEEYVEESDIYSE